MIDIRYTTKFRKDFKMVKKRGCNVELFQEVLSILQNGQQLPQKYKDHSLSGNYSGCRECHITPDWLLIYRYDDDNGLVLILTRTGTHSDLF